MPLFENVSYHLSQSLAEHTRLEISRILDCNGGTGVPLDLATHILSDTIEFEGCDTLRGDVVCVSPYWVERSMELGHLQDPKYFSADKDMFFSGIVATSADLPPGDKEVIASGILAQGGAWREGLTRDVTHLFVTNTRSEKYQTAMHFRDSAHITIVLPQWFDQCWSTQMRLPSDVFQFPDPPYLRKDHDIAAYKAQIPVKMEAASGLSLTSGPDKQAMYGTMQGADTSYPSAARTRNIWQSRSILLSPLLELNAQRRESVEARIRRAGGVVVTAQEGDESIVVEQADILITRFRTGVAYVKALAAGKTIGTLAWLFYVERTGIVSRPRDQLLHYPVRSKPIQGFSDHEITVTNYQGDAREYLKKLIEIMGAKFTPTMSGRNTIVIAAYKSGNKTAKAEEWSVPVVTHKWLEDCFVEWRNLTPAQKKYVDYAPGVNYGTILGDRGVGRVGLEEDPELSLDIKKDPTRIEKQPKDQQPKEAEKPVGEGWNGTGTSVREALEVDEVEDVLHIGGDPHKDLDDTRKDSLLSQPNFGPPRGITKTSMKKTASAERPSAKPREVADAPVESTDANLKTLNIAEGPPKGRLDSNLSQTDLPNEPAPGQSNTPMKVGTPVKSRSQSRLTPRVIGLTRLMPSPDHIVSVDLPDPRSLLTSIRRRRSLESVGSLSDHAPRAVEKSRRTKAVRVSAYEASHSSKRGVPVAKRGVDSRSPSPSPHRSPRRVPLASSITARKGATTPNSTPLARFATQRTPSRRTAAAAATQKLRDEVMPDVVNFESERSRDKKGGRRGKSSQLSIEDDDEAGEESDTEPRDKKRHKVADYDGGRRSGRKGKGLSGSSAEDSDMPPGRFVTTVKNLKRPADADKHTSQSRSRKRVRKEESVSEHGSDAEETPNLSSFDPKKMRILTTKVVVSEQVEKALIKLGMRFTQKPQECTHLVTNSLSRTEKFLCALPNVPFVLSMDWLTACANFGSVVAEDDYLLQDPDTEHKYKFKLVDALERARQLKKKKKKLLQGHFFYITPGVPANFNVLKNVLHALGAECRETIPTIRNVSETRHVISSLRDESLWRPLVKHGVTIYSHELILGAAFTQFVDWDGEDKILAD